MKQRALDSNIILRYLLQDDPQQCALVDTLFESAHLKGDRFWISSLVLLECLWVLECHYEVSRSDLILCLERLADSSIFELEHAEAIPKFLLQTQSNRHKPVGDLSDLLIASMNATKGAKPTLTFDKKASKAAPEWIQLLT